MSPFKPEKAAIESGRIMLRKIKQNIKHQIDFAFETTLATKGYVNTIEYSREYGYKATLLFFWLNNPLLAIERVKARVAEGGHNIPTDIIERRYYSGLKNLFRLYLAKCNYWLILNNSNPVVEIIAEGSYDSTIKVENIQLFEKIKKTSYGK